jgi:nucleoside 2-deoxyribosyltransferase
MAAEGRAAAVYVASPLGFTEAGRHYHERVVRPAFEAKGYRILDPWEEEHAGTTDAHSARKEQAATLAESNERIAQSNQASIEQCDAVLALLDGADVDSGVAVEIGFAYALGRPIVGWRSDLRRAGENAGTAVNLQVSHFVLGSGGRLASGFAEAIDTLDGVLQRASST